MKATKHISRSNKRVKHKVRNKPEIIRIVNILGRYPPVFGPWLDLRWAYSEPIDGDMEE